MAVSAVKEDKSKNKNATAAVAAKEVIEATRVAEARGPVELKAPGTCITEQHKPVLGIVGSAAKPAQSFDREKLKALMLEQLGGVSRHLTMEEALQSNAALRYVMGNKGVLEIRDNEIGTFRVKADVVHGAPILEEGFELKLPKVPYELFHVIVKFFRDVMARMSNSEAMVQIFWDREKQEYFLAVPEQNVSGTSVHYTRDQELENKHVLVMDVHSHNTMNAFWSGTDTNDEKETRFFGVLGRLNSENFEYKFRMCCGGKTIDNLNIYQLFEQPYSEVSYPEEWFGKVKHGTGAITYANGQQVRSYSDQAQTRFEGGYQQGKNWGGTNGNVSAGQSATQQSSAGNTPAFSASDYRNWGDEDYGYEQYYESYYGTNKEHGGQSPWYGRRLEGTNVEKDAKAVPALVDTNGQALRSNPLKQDLGVTEVLDLILENWSDKEVAQLFIKLGYEGYDDVLETCSTILRDEECEKENNKIKDIVTQAMD